MNTANTRQSTALLVTTALVPALFAMATPAAAQSWDGGAGTENWFDAANWLPDGVPIDFRAVNLDSQDSVSLTANSANLTSVDIQDLASLAVRAQLNSRITTVDDRGRLVITPGGSVNGNIEVVGGSAVLANNGIIRGNVVFSPFGSGLATFFSNGTVTGSTTFNGGMLNIEFNSNLSDTEAFIVNGGTVNVNRAEVVGPLSGTGGVITFLPGSRLTTNVTSGASAYSGRMSGISLNGAISFEKAGAGTMILTGNSDYQGATLISGGTLQIGNGGTSGSLGRGNIINNGSLVFNRSDNGTLNNFIFGSGSLTKLGSGSLTLSGENAYTGDTIVNGGILTYLGPNPFGVTGTVRMANGTTLRGVNPGSTAIRNNIVITGSATFDNATDTGPDVFGIISGGQLVKTGGGRALLYGANTYSGGTLLQQGTLTVVNNQAFGSGTVSMSGGTTIESFGTYSISNPLVLNAGTARINTVVAGQTLTLAGTLSGLGGLQKIGAGSLSLVDPGLYDGVITVSAGTLVIRGDRGLGTSVGGTIVEDGATLSFARGVWLNDDITINGMGANAIGALRHERSGNARIGQLNGTITLGSASRINNDGVLFVNGSVVGDDDLTIGGAGGITYFDGGLDIGTGSLIVDGGNAVFLRTSNSFTGATKVTLGAVTVLSNNALSDIAPVTLGEFSSLTLGSTWSETIGNLAGTGSVIIDTGATLSVGLQRTNSTFGGLISGAGALTKVGTGTLTLSGDNTYAGLTSVDAGTLLITGSLVGAVTVNAGGTLGGTGTIGGAVSIDDGGTISVGLSPGTMTFATLALGSGSTSIFELGEAGVAGGSNNDLIAVTGELALNGGTIRVVRGAGFGSGQYTLFTFGSLTGALGNLTLDSIGGDFIGNLALGDGAVLLNTAALSDLVWWNGMTTTPTGTVEGGDGIWSLAGGNFTNSTATVSAPWAGNDSMVVFGGTAGTVVIAAGEVLSPAGMSFRTDGYAITGADATSGLALNGPTGIDTAAGVGATIAAVISGPGSLTKTGEGTLTLTASNSFTGPTMVLGGTLVNRGGIAGAVAVASRLTNSGTISGGLEVMGGSQATNDASGTINDGVTVQESGTLTSTGTIAGGLTNSGSAEIAGVLSGDVLNTGSIRLTGRTQGIGTLTQTGASRLELAGFDTAMGGLVGAGTITLGAARLTAGSANSTTVFGGVIEGSGALTKVGTGGLVLTGANTYVGGTTISGGVLQLGNGGTSGSLVGSVVNNATLVISRGDAFTLSNLVSGTGVLVQDGIGTTTLTAANTYTGGTLVRRGRLVGNTTSVNGLVQIDSGATLELAEAATGTFAGELVGTGRFDKTGAGLLTLTANSSGFRGGTIVRAGQLRVSGNLSRSVVTVQSGATLSGNGLIGGLVAQSGSVIAPGTSPGTLTVNGNVNLLAGSTVQYEISATSPSDLILATGTAALGGTAAFTNLGGTYAFNSEILLLQADGGITGSFASSTGLDGFGMLYRPEIVYTATQARLRLAPNLLSNIIGSTTLTANQRSVANGIDRAVGAGYNPQPLLSIYALPTAQLPGAFDQLSGEVYATAAGVGIEQERLLREAVLGRASSAAMGARTAPETASGVGAWGQLFGGWGDGESDGDAAAFDADRMGFVTGLDYGNANETGSWRAGVFGMQVQSDVTIAARGSAAEVEQAGGGAYASLTAGGFGATLGGYLTEVDLRGFRDINLPGFSETNVGVTEGEGRQAFAELSYTIATGKALIRPFVAGSVGSFKLDGLRENGGSAALEIRDQSYSTETLTGGIDGSVQIGKSLRLGGTLAARARFGDRDPQALLALAAAPEQAFAINGAQLDELAFAGRFEAAVQLEENLAFSVGYTGLLGKTQSDHGARATIQIRF